jgi:CCR4-NOT transcriptional complex subunit CAF120
MNGTQSGTLQNVLSISTAANNRYLLHFNSLNSLTQWTAGIRLAMFEHSALQEAYTGSLIAGKGKFLNNVRQIMERSRFVYEDWARVRFGAGTPWKRCWCVITPPDEKEFAKAQKLAKKNPYERMRMPKGDVRFYDTRKVTKKTRPLATISDAYAAYAIYPQAKPLIDQSTLVKVEGLITQHTKPEKTTEGFVFVMPEVHPAVSGFEMMLRWLFPVFDTFALYGRPTRLIADVIDQRGLMFAMPRDRRYGFLDTLDVSGLIHTTGSQNWSERQWRNEMKKLTSTRMAAMMEGSPRPSQQIGQRRATTSRQSLPPNRMSLRFDDSVTHSSPGSRSGSPAGASRGPAPGSLDRTDSAPPTASSGPHKRSASDVYAYRKRATDTPSRLSQEIPRDDDYGDAPRPPPHGMSSDPSLAETYNSGAVSPVGPDGRMSVYGSYEKSAQSADHRHSNIPLPVHSPPPFAHAPSDRPAGNLNQASDLRRAHAAVDEDTLYQMQDARQTGISPVEDDAYTASQPSGQQQAFLPYRSRENTVQQPSYHQNNSYNGGYDSYEPRDRVQRLSTIPGSPFVGEDTEYFARTPVQQHMPPLSENGSMSHHSTGAHTPDAQSPSAGSRASIARKPVPRLASEAPDEYSARYGNNQNPQVRTDIDREEGLDTPPSPVGSHVAAMIDASALERFLSGEDLTTRADTMQTTVSSATPDYASTPSMKSVEEKQVPAEKPRAGRMKVVGDPDLVSAKHPKSGGAGRLDTYARDNAEDYSEMPTIDFGPTYSYKPSSRPGTSGTLSGADGLHRRTKSRDYLAEGFQDRTIGQAKQEDEVIASVAPQQPTIVAWTGPPSTSGEFESATSDRLTLSPEQWVQHRANIVSSQPQHAVPSARRPLPALPPSSPPAIPFSSRPNSFHDMNQLLSPSSITKTPPPFIRGSSGDWTTLRQSPLAQTPPLARATSGDWSALSPSSITQTPPPFIRASSGDWAHLRGQPTRPISRPTSRGAGAVLTAGAMKSSFRSESPITSSSMNAREQMHIARATGTPLLGYSATTSPRMVSPITPLSTSPGLVGALAARERERAAWGEGVRSTQVKEAIALRMKEQQQQQLMHAHLNAQLQAQAQLESHIQLQQLQQAQIQQAQLQEIQHQALLQQQQNLLFQQHQARQLQQPFPLYASSITSTTRPTTPSQQQPTVPIYQLQRPVTPSSAFTAPPGDLYMQQQQHTRHHASASSSSLNLFQQLQQHQQQQQLPPRPSTANSFASSSMHASSSIPGSGGFGGVFVQQQQALVRGGAAGAGAGAFRHSRGKSETSVLTRLGYES